MQSPNYFLRRGEGNKAVALEDTFLWANSWFLLRQPRPVWLLWRSLSLLAQNRNVLSRNLLFDFYPNDTVHKIFRHSQGRSQTQFLFLGGRGWGWHLPSLLDTTYEPASNHCILLKKILFNELPVQNLKRAFALPAWPCTLISCEQCIIIQIAVRKCEIIVHSWNHALIGHLTIARAN